MYIFALVVVALIAFLVGNKFGSGVVADIKKEVEAIDTTASLDARLLAAKIKSLL